MDAATIDYGPYVGVLQAFGPPEVVTLPDFAGTGSAVEDVQGFWEEVLSVSFQLVTDGSVAARYARVSAFAGESAPFVQVVAPYEVDASHTSRLTFGVGAFPAGFSNSPGIVAGLPRLLLLPGWSLAADVIAGVAGDAISAVRVCRQRYRVIEIE